MSIEDGQGKMPGKLITVEGLDGSGKVHADRPCEAVA